MARRKERGGNDPREDGAPQLGPKLRALRAERGLSLATVARDTGISSSFLSLVENGTSDISFGRLHRLVDYYGVHITDLLDEPKDPVDVEGQIRAGSEPHLRSAGEGIDLYLLARDTERRMLPLLSVLAPGAATTDWEGHDGEEFVHVLQGSVEIRLKGRQPVVLRKGDSLYYGGRDPEAMRNPTSREARLFVVISPPIL